MVRVKDMVGAGVRAGVSAWVRFDFQQRLQRKYKIYRQGSSRKLLPAEFFKKKRPNRPSNTVLLPFHSVCLYLLHLEHCEPRPYYALTSSETKLHFGKWTIKTSNRDYYSHFQFRFKYKLLKRSFLIQFSTEL